MDAGAPLEFLNGQSVGEDAIPLLPRQRFHDAVLRECGAESRLAALVARPLRSGALRVHALLARDLPGLLAILAMDLPPGDRSYPALTPELPEAQGFERELAEQHGVDPVGHPWLKPVRAFQDHHGASAYPFFEVGGSGIHEVAVGPVHAGVIEPGHFRFQCDGERVLHLEIQLGYQHRGAEALLVRGDRLQRVVTAESIAGDSVVAHALAHCETVEALAGVEVPLRGQALRALALELERVANHLGDLGALAGDIGYLAGAAWFGRLRGDALGMSLDLTGSRYGRGFCRPGGVTLDLDAERARGLADRVARLVRELREVSDLFFGSNPVLARLEGAGTLTFEAAAGLGLVGPAARASGCDRDARRDHPAGYYRFALIPTVRLDSGDVYARAMVRRLEAQRSLAFLAETLTHLPPGELRAPVPALAPGALAVALVEGWRGETLHLLATGPAGEVALGKVVDPSFHDWPGLAMAMRGEEISNFPLCNKSFNLSYAGHDL
jgi:Ni,Fe-hydrogenase III large subunit